MYLIVEIKDTLTMIGNHILDLHPTRNENFGYVVPAKLRHNPFWTINLCKPVLRLYCESSTLDRVHEILAWAKSWATYI